MNLKQKQRISFNVAFEIVPNIFSNPFTYRLWLTSWGLYQNLYALQAYKDGITTSLSSLLVFFLTVKQIRHDYWPVTSTSINSQ